MVADIIVAGAGPAGATAAYVAAKKGVSVILIEKNRYPGLKVCAGYVDNRIWKFFDLPREVIEREIWGCIAVSPSNKEYVAKFSRPGVSIYRDAFDKWLANLATDEGAKLLVETTAVDTVKDKKYINGCFAKRGANFSQLECKVLIAADGVTSNLALKAGLRTRYGRDGIAHAIQYVYSSTEDHVDGMIGDFYIECYGSSVSPFGYGWVCPKRKDFVIGIVSPLGFLDKPLKFYLNRFIREHQFIRKIVKGAILKKVENGLIPYSGPIPITYTDGMLVVGDAAGVVGKFSGDGIINALVTGQIAAEIATEAICENDLSSSKLKEYEQRWRGLIGVDLKSEDEASKAYGDDGRLEILLAKIFA